MTYMKYLPIVALAGALAATSCKKADEPAAGAAAARPPTQVVAIPATRQPVTESLSLIGSLAANEQIELKAETDGTVEKINFDEGEPVEAGRLLVKLDDTKARAQLAEAKANYALSKGNYDRAKQLLNDKLISQQEFDQTAASFSANEAAVALQERQLKDTAIAAPFKGIVSARLVSPGQVITRNTTLTWLVDLDPLKVEVNVPERFLSQVLPGQKLALKVAAWPQRTFTGTVYFASPYVNPDTRTMLIKARVPNSDAALKPGMFAGLELTLNVRTNALVVPEAAINQVLEGGRAMVMVVNSESKVEVRQVKVGMRLESKVEITDGLSDGDQIIVEGLQKIAPGMPVKLAPAEAMKPYLPAAKPEDARS